MKAPAVERLRLIKLIHVARHELEREGKMDEPTYRTMLQTAGGADSTSKMAIPALQRVLDQAKKAGFKVRAKSPDRPQDTGPQARKVRALWLFLHELGAVKDPSERALAVYVKRIAKVDDLHWTTGPMIHSVIETLKKWAMRVLPAAINTLKVEAAALARAGRLNQEQLDACQGAHNRIRDTVAFDAHWYAWSTFTEVLGRLVPPAVRVELGMTP